MPKMTLAGRKMNNPSGGMATEDSATSADIGRTIRENFFHKICLDGPKSKATGNRWGPELMKGGGGGVLKNSGSCGSCSTARVATLIWGAPQEGQKGVCSSIWPAQR